MFHLSLVVTRYTPLPSLFACGPEKEVRLRVQFPHEGGPVERLDDALAGENNGSRRG